MSDIFLQPNRVFVPKGWGYEDWLVNKKEYCGKLLFFKKGKHCSFHYHKLKDETFYVHRGELLIVYSEEDCLATDGEHIEVDLDVNTAPASVVSRLFVLRSWLDFNAVCRPWAEYCVLTAGDTFHVPVGLRHAMYAIQDTQMFEFSTEHFDSDSYRVLKGD